MIAPYSGVGTTTLSQSLLAWSGDRFSLGRSGREAGDQANHVSVSVTGGRFPWPPSRLVDFECESHAPAHTHSRDRQTAVHLARSAGYASRTPCNSTRTEISG